MANAAVNTEMDGLIKRMREAAERAQQDAEAQAQQLTDSPSSEGDAADGGDDEEAEEAEQQGDEQANQETDEQYGEQTLSWSAGVEMACLFAQLLVARPWSDQLPIQASPELKLQTTTVCKLTVSPIHSLVI